MSHVPQMIKLCFERVHGLEMAGAYPAKGAKRAEMMGAEALAFCVGYESALMAHGLIGGMSPIVWVVSIRGYSVIEEAYEKQVAAEKAA